MNTPPQTIAAPAPSASRAATASAVWELTKPGITRMVLITTLVGFILGGLGFTWTLPELALTLAATMVGTAFSSAGANALNMWLERRRDALMTRTAGRPVPSGRLSPQAALNIGLACSIIGPSLLCAWASPAAAVIAASTILLYIAVYTPLKPVTPLSTIVGALPGALPPLIGFAAAFPMAGSFAALADPAGWSLVALMAVWQIPHFLAIAWMYKDDYAAGGHRLITSEDPTGTRTATAALIWIAALFPVSLAPVLAMPGLLGWPYIALATFMNLVFAAAAVRFARERARTRAVKMFLVSIAWLPLVLLAMVGEATLRTLL